MTTVDDGGGDGGDVFFYCNSTTTSVIIMDFGFIIFTFAIHSVFDQYWLRKRLFSRETSKHNKNQIQIQIQLDILLARQCVKQKCSICNKFEYNVTATERRYAHTILEWNVQKMVWNQDSTRIKIYMAVIWPETIWNVEKSRKKNVLHIDCLCQFEHFTKFKIFPGFLFLKF